MLDAHGILHQSQQRHIPESASQQYPTYMEKLFAPCIVVGVVALQVLWLHVNGVGGSLV
jgi:hypothetical protein